MRERERGGEREREKERRSNNKSYRSRNKLVKNKQLKLIGNANIISIL